MKFIIALLMVGSVSQAAQEFLIDGKAATKLEATKALIKNPGSNVIKACNVELTDKLTLRCKKAPQKVAGN